MGTWIAFLAASALILIIPGPTIIMVVSQAVGHGRKSVAPLVAGVVLGDFTAMTLSLLGLGALMTASSTLFTFFKWVGALYLVYLGVKVWRAQPERYAVADSAVGKGSAKALFRSSFIVTALNPKSIGFFVTFLPQFIDPAEPVLPQMTLLGGTFLALAMLNASLYAFFAGHLRQHLRQGKMQGWLSRCGGGALIGAGIVTAAMQRSS